MSSSSQSPATNVPETTGQLLLAGWRGLSLLERIYFVVFTVPPFLAVVMGSKAEKLVNKLLGRKRPTSFKPVQITQDVFQIYYCVPNEGGVNSTVIRDPKGKSLLLHSAPPCTDETVADLQELGKLEVVLVPSTAHDSHAKAWAERYPSIKIVTHPRVKDFFSKSCRVDETYETNGGKAILKQYGIVEYVDVSEYQHFPDAHLLLSTPGPVGEERYIVLAECGFMGSRNKRITVLIHPLACVAGLGPRRVTRHACLLFVADCDRMSREWTELVSRDKVFLTIHQHGEPLPAMEARNYLVTRNPFRNTF